MPQDAFTIYHYTKELDALLKGAKINRVTQPDKDEVDLLTYSFSGSRVLALSAGAQSCRVSFTSHEKPNPKTAPAFCMLMRKHLLGATIESVEIVGFERIIKITFSGRNDFKEQVKKVLYCEIMGKYSNLILTENGIILGCLKNAPLDVATTRTTLSGAKYSLPKPQDKVELTNKDEAISRLSAYMGGELDKFIFENVKGFSFPTALEAAESVKGFLSAEDLYERLYNFVFNPQIKPNITGEGKLRDFYVIDYKTLESPKTYFDSVSDAQDVFYSAKDKKKAFDGKKKTLVDKVNALIKKHAKKLQGESEKLLEASDCDSLRIKGELITANLYRLSKGMTSCTLENWYEDNKPITINLDKMLTPNENAQRLFKKYVKEKRTVEILTPQKERTEKELNYLNSVILELEQATSIDDFNDIEDELISSGILPAPKFKKKEVKESPYRVYNVDGFTVKCGKNNVQNDRLTGRAFKDDIWLHTKDYHSSHVIIETKGTGVPDRVKLVAAEICAYFSDARNGTKVPVDYTYKKFVKKPPKAKPGSVIYTDFKTLLVTPSEHGELLVK